MNNYKCELSKFAELKRRINAITRKLNKYGLECHFEVVAEYPQEVDYFVECSDTHRLVNAGTIVVDVVEYTFEMPELKLSDWTPVAVIKHNVVVDSNANIVTAINGYDTKSIPKHYWTAHATCEHCHSNRKRKTTVLLKHNNGELIQVGSTCVKDFTGINAEDIIKTYADITDIFETPLTYCSHGEYVESKYMLTHEFLTAAIAEIAKNGYRKNNVTTDVAWNSARNHTEFSDEFQQKARRIIEFFREMDPDDFGTNWDFYRNIKSALASEYSKLSGLVAYAPVAYESALAYMKQQEARKSELAKSEWVGNIKDRITCDVTHIRTHVIEGFYGTTCLHIFKDDEDNTLIWSTGTYLTDILGTDWRDQDVRRCRITGTVKAHDVYNDEKQTAITRCKVSAIED